LACRLVLLGQDGPELNVLAKNDLGESIIGSPAIADGHLYFRTRSKLTCIGK
jgi:hypothetical protein